MCQPLDKTGDSENGWGNAICDLQYDPRGNKCQRSQQSDVAFDLTLPHGDFGERSDPTLDEIVDPDSGLRDGGEQDVARLCTQPRGRRRRMEDALNLAERGNRP